MWAIAVAIMATCLLAIDAWAKDVAITIPWGSNSSIVQRLNRQGVEAVAKHQYQKAEAAFYKAYLFDPSDPFTLNNLGVISEIEGRLDHATKFYQLALEQSCSAQIALSSEKSLEKKPMRAALEGIDDLPMRVNHLNVVAMQLISENRAFEAAALLHQALALDKRNPFTLNNLGVADEAIGDYRGALEYYHLAAASGSNQPVIVTESRAWSGKPVSGMAAASAERLEKRIREGNTSEVEAAFFNMRGVLAANQNEWPSAQQYFLKAYSLNPESAFSLNNRGIVAEREGDLESAEFFYQKAKAAGDAARDVGLATDAAAQGKPLDAVAGASDQKVSTALAVYSHERRRESGPIELIPRGPGSEEPEKPQSNQSKPSQAPPGAGASRQ
jgi:Flp pilus assembly protein TadD